MFAYTYSQNRIPVLMIGQEFPFILFSSKFFFWYRNGSLVLIGAYWSSPGLPGIAQWAPVSLVSSFWHGSTSEPQSAQVSTSEHQWAPVNPTKKVHPTTIFFLNTNRDSLLLNGASVSSCEPFRATDTFWAIVSPYRAHFLFDTNFLA